jgi:hypothetical protein
LHAYHITNVEEDGETFSVVIEMEAKWRECRTDNNSANLPHMPCTMIF